MIYIFFGPLVVIPHTSSSRNGSEVLNMLKGKEEKGGGELRVCVCQKRRKGGGDGDGGGGE